ncbi:flagellar hook-length control protein FliK [uncultured Roseibium sp.]|uniref:flagellar hook-length control protein FliK n=1 Tax=uncultured Roseibium sp. TaxID=1936171 RepID=UPI00260D502A|nr:flagellar hook-length control protein FliK [uncultured Roseibium sp.]
MVETVSAQTLPQGASGSSSAKGLEPGTELKAKVEQNMPGGVVRLATAETKLDLRVPAPLPVGADVTVTVSGSRQQPLIQISTLPEGGQVANSTGQQPTTPGNGASAPPTAQGPGVSIGTALRPAPTMAHMLQSVAPPAPQSEAGSAALRPGVPPLAQSTAPRTRPSISSPLQLQPSESGVKPPMSASGSLPSAEPRGSTSSQFTTTQSGTSFQVSPRVPGTAQLTGAQNPVNAPTPSAGAPGSLQVGGRSSVQISGQMAGPASGQLATVAPPSLPVNTAPGSAQSPAQVFGSEQVMGAPRQSLSAPQATGQQSANPQQVQTAGAIPGGQGTQATPSQPAATGNQGVPIPNVVEPRQTLTGQTVQTQTASAAINSGLSSAPKKGAGGVPPASPLPSNTPQSGQVGPTVPARAQSASAPVSGGRAPAHPNSVPSQVATSTSLGTNTEAAASRTPASQAYATATVGSPAGQTAATQQRVFQQPVVQAAAQLQKPLTEQQASYSALFAQIGSLMSAQTAGKVSMPDAVVKAMQQILGLRLNAGQPPTAQSLQQAVSQSGQFHEAGLARSGGGNMPLPDLKSVLLSFKSLLRSMGAEEQISRPAGQAAPPARHGSPQGQAPQAASGFWAGAAAQNLQALLKDTDASLARLRLNQLVNSGLAGEEGPRAASRPMDVVLELPLALGQETAIMQMQIGRDGNGSHQEDDHEPAWRLRFALDLTATGPLEAAISLRGGGTYASLWVDRKETFDNLNSLRETMEAAFADAGLDLQEFRLIRGLPPRTAARYGALIDRQS